MLPAEAPWLTAFRSELKAFTSGKYDDQADSFSQFVAHQHVNWPWVIIDYMFDGRTASLVRNRTRPW